MVLLGGVVDAGGLVVPGVAGEAGEAGDAGVAGVAGEPGAPGDAGVAGVAGEAGTAVSGMVPGAVAEPGVVGVPGVGSGLVPGVMVPGLETPGEVADPGAVGLGDAELGAVSLGMADGVPLGDVVSGVTVVESLLLGAALPFRWRCWRCVVVPGVLWVVVLGVVVWGVLLLPVVLEGVCAVAQAARNANDRAVVARGFNIRIGVLLCRSGRGCSASVRRFVREGGPRLREGIATTWATA